VPEEEKHGSVIAALKSAIREELLEAQRAASRI